MVSLTQLRYTSISDDLLARAAADLQLTDTQYKLAVQRYETIGAWLSAEGTLLAPYRPAIYPQGSLRLGTTVKPIGRNEYDLDLVCQLNIDWSRSDAVAVLELVERRLLENETYRGMTEKLNRCIRITYANQFHLDILPAAPDTPSGVTCVRVPDRSLSDWKHSNPIGYADWFEERAAIRLAEMAAARAVEPVPAPEDLFEKPPLKIAVQILKRWRDVRYAKLLDIAPISIVLTTLAAHHYAGEESPLVALTAVVDRIVAAIPMNGRLVVLNPKNRSEDLSEKWDKDKKAYGAFIDGMVELRDQLRAVASKRGLPHVRSALAPMLGEDLTDRMINQQGQFIEEQRRAGNLRVAGTGALTTTVAGTTPIVKNTFYGE